MCPETVERCELTRIRAAYARRARAIPRNRYARIQPANLCAAHDRESAMAALFQSSGLRSLAGLKILDIGCDLGGTLRQLLDYDAEPSRLFGIDLLDERVQQARHLAPHLQFACGNAAHLPFPDSSFDFVLQFLLFTSVLSDVVKQSIANEIDRVLTQRGRLLWYDFAYNNPGNPDVRGVGKAEIQKLFPGYGMKLRRITLAPPLGRLVAALSPAIYLILAQLRPLCTHYLCLLEKPLTGASHHQ